MRLGPDAPLHLTYSPALHPGEDWPAVRRQLDAHVPALKAQLAPDRPFGIGLRLSDWAAGTLLGGSRLAALRAWLAAEGSYVCTVDGRAFGSLTGGRVKERVYAPDWRHPMRVAYTARLARILAALLPENVDGSLSTVPVAYAPGLEGEAARGATVALASTRLAEAAAVLARLHRTTGRLVHLTLDLRAGGLLETAADAVAFFAEGLVPRGRRLVADRLGTTPADAEQLLRRHVRVGYSTAAAALTDETPEQAFARLSWAGIGVGTVRIGAGLRVPLPAGRPARRSLAVRLAPLARSTHLHPVDVHHADGRTWRYDDLADALPHLDDCPSAEWRIRGPLSVAGGHRDRRTGAAVRRTLAALPVTGCRHLELEAPAGPSGPARAGDPHITRRALVRDYRWTLQQGRRAGLLEAALPTAAPARREAGPAAPTQPVPASTRGAGEAHRRPALESSKATRRLRAMAIA
jgi:hypothetical protein